MIYSVTHTTTYVYSQPVSLCHNLVHLTPRTTYRQTCIVTSLEVAPRPAVESAHVDFFGNTAHFLTIQEPHKCLTLTARHMVEVRAVPAPPAGRDAAVGGGSGAAGAAGRRPYPGGE